MYNSYLESKEAVQFIEISSNSLYSNYLVNHNITDLQLIYIFVNTLVLLYLMGDY